MQDKLNLSRTEWGLHTSCWITSSHKWRSVPFPLSSCLSYIDFVIKFWYVTIFAWNLFWKRNSLYISIYQVGKMYHSNRTFRHTLLIFRVSYEQKKKNFLIKKKPPTWSRSSHSKLIFRVSYEQKKTFLWEKNHLREVDLRTVSNQTR